MLRALAALAALLAPSTATAWSGTPTFAWQRCPEHYCETGWYASPAAADVDGDGDVEVFWGGYTLLAVDGATGALEWSYAGSGGRLWPSPAVADVDGSGAREIVVANHDGIVSVLRANGTPLTGWPREVFPSAEARTLAVADLDGDGAQEIAVARAASGSSGHWTVLEANGTTRPGWPRRSAPDPGYAAGCYNQNVAIADLDGDGLGELAVSSDVHYLGAYEDDAAQIGASATYGSGKVWSQVGVHYDHAVDLRGYANCAAGPPLEPRPNFADSAPVVADLDGDGALEIVIVGNFYDCRTDPYTSLFQLPLILDRDRSRWAASGFDWTTLPVPDGDAAPLAEDYDVIQTALPNPALADLDGDRRAEILFPSYDGRLHAFWLDKTEKHGWPLDLNAGAGPLRFASEPAVADLDGDGSAEVLFTTWGAIGSHSYGELRVVDARAAPLASVPLPTPAGDDWGGALGAPTLANLDADPDLEVVVGTTGSGLVAYELPGTAQARVLWGTGRGRLDRSGLAPALVPEPGATRSGVAAALGLVLAAGRRWRR